MCRAHEVYAYIPSALKEVSVVNRSCLMEKSNHGRKSMQSILT